MLRLLFLLLPLIAAEPVHVPLKRAVPVQDVQTWSDSRGSRYYLTLHVGTPQQPVDVQVDTGSSRLLLVSPDCSTCDNTTSFNATASSTFKGGDPLTALFARSSYNGTWGDDIVSLGTWSEKHEFGLIDGTVNETSAPSILGLGWKSPVNSWSKEWEEPLFGVYLSRPSTPAGEDAGGSLVTFGGLAADAIDGELTYYSSEVKDDWYVPLDSVTIGGYEIPLEDHIGALDTGTSGIYMPDSVLEEIFAQLPGADVDAGSFPCQQLNFSITIGGTVWPVYWGDLIWRSVGQGRDAMCYSNLYANGGLTPNLRGNKWILGDAFLRNVYSAYRYDPPRVGLARLKDEYNWRTNVVPNAWGSVVADSTGGEASSGGGIGSERTYPSGNSSHANVTEVGGRMSQADGAGQLGASRPVLAVVGAVSLALAVLL